MNLAQSLVDFTPIIKALNDAGITGYLLVGLIAGFFAYRIALLRLKNEGVTTNSNAAVLTSVSNAITTLTTNNTTIIQAMQEMQTGARKRDLQFDKMNDIQEQQNKATSEQNKLLSDLKGATESGHEFTKKLVDSVVDGSKDTSAAVQHLDQRIADNTERIVDIANSLDGSFKAIHDDIAKIIDPDLATKVVEKLRPDVVAMFDKALAKCLDENATLAKELDHTEEKLDDTHEELSKVARTALIVAANMQPEPPTPSNAIDPDTGEARKVA